MLYIEQHFHVRKHQSVTISSKINYLCRPTAGHSQGSCPLYTSMWFDSLLVHASIDIIPYLWCITQECDKPIYNYKTDVV